MVDRYTKAVLTVIAAALVAIVVQNCISSSAAQTASVPCRPAMVGATAPLSFGAKRALPVSM